MATTRVYAAGSRKLLLIDDLSAAPTSVKIDLDGDDTYETTLTTGDYELLPRNAAEGPEPRPFTSLGIHPSASTIDHFEGRIEIVGLFGWPSIPVAIKVATIELAALWRIETPRATRRVNEMGQVESLSREASSLMNQWLYAYVKRAGAGAF